MEKQALSFLTGLWFTKIVKETPESWKTALTSHVCFSDVLRPRRSGWWLPSLLEASDERVGGRVGG